MKPNPKFLPDPESVFTKTKESPGRQEGGHMAWCFPGSHAVCMPHPSRGRSVPWGVCGCAMFFMALQNLWQSPQMLLMFIFLWAECAKSHSLVRHRSFSQSGQLLKVKTLFSLEVSQKATQYFYFRKININIWNSVRSSFWRNYTSMGKKSGIKYSAQNLSTEQGFLCFLDLTKGRRAVSKRWNHPESQGFVKWCTCIHTCM